MKATLTVFFTLSFIAGFAGTATFIQLSGLFSSHVTGNFVMLAAAWKKGAHDGDNLKIMAVPVFVVAVFSATLVHGWLRGDSPEVTIDQRLAPAAGTLLLLAAGIALLYGHGGGECGYSFADAAVGMITVVAMGIQNAIHRFSPSLVSRLRIAARFAAR